MIIDKEKIKADLEQRVAKCLSSIFDGNVEDVLAHIDKRAYLIHAFKKQHLKVNVNATYDFDEAYVNSLTNTQLSNLTKFYTVFETRYFNRHSVTAIPYLLHLLNKRDCEYYEELVNWAIKTANSENPYIPFGALKYASCKSLSEYKSLVSL